MIPPLASPTQPASPVATTAGSKTYAPRASCQPKRRRASGAELSLTFGGYVPHTGKKLFFFGAYDRFHASAAPPIPRTSPSPLRS